MFRRLYRSFDQWLTGNVNPDPIILSSFTSPMELSAWKLFSDASFGGKSFVNLSKGPEGKTALFHGTWSKDKGESTKLVRSGYVGMNKAWELRTVNLSMHDYIDWHIKGDGNTYMASIRVNQMTGGDEEAWQAPLKTHKGQWERIRIELDDFLFSFRGRLPRAKASVGLMPRKEIIAIGLSLSASDSMPETGGFSLEVGEVTAGAHIVEGDEARRKAFRGDLEFRVDVLSEIKAEEAGLGRSRSVWGGEVGGAVGGKGAVFSIGGKGLRKKVEVKQEE